MDQNEEAAPQLLRLFIVGNSEACRAALRNLKLVVAEFLPPSSKITVVDLLEEPEEAERNAVLAVPMLVRDEPLPVRRIVGDLSDRRRVLISLGAMPSAL
jgi:circadian clock protein KaiB